MASIVITENELLDELAAMGPKPAPAHAMTTGELCAKLGLCRSAMKKRLGLLREQGRLEVWQVKRIDGTGRVQTVPAYTIKPAAPKRVRSYPR
jgi:hypothetical protein